MASIDPSKMTDLHEIRAALDKLREAEVRLLALEVLLTKAPSLLMPYSLAQAHFVDNLEVLAVLTSNVLAGAYSCVQRVSPMKHWLLRLHLSLRLSKMHCQTLLVNS